MRRALLLGGGVALAACSILTSFDGISPHEPSSVDDAGDATTTDGDALDAGCRLARWPAAPSGADDGRSIGTITQAIDKLSLVGSGTSVVGYDIDGLCTCPDRTACIGDRLGEPCDDGDAGVDNAVDGLFRLIESRGVAIDDKGLSSALAKGRFGIVVRVDDYNGLPDDPKVKVTVFNAVAVNRDQDGKARFDGTDEWVLDKESFVDKGIPLFSTTTAWVTGGVLVAPLPQLILRLRYPVVVETDQFGLVQIDLRDAHVVARITTGATGAATMLTDGVVTGRSPASALLAQMVRSGACRDGGLYPILKLTICGARDLGLLPSNDGTNVSCDALSVGLGFHAITGNTAPDADLATDVFPCDDNSPDSCN